MTNPVDRILKGFNGPLKKLAAFSTKAEKKIAADNKRAEAIVSKVTTLSSQVAEAKIVHENFSEFIKTLRTPKVEITPSEVTTVRDHTPFEVEVKTSD